MTRIYQVGYAEHLTNGQEGDTKVDTWRNQAYTVSVVDGYGDEAIQKLTGVLVEKDKELSQGAKAERHLTSLSLVAEAL